MSPDSSSDSDDDQERQKLCEALDPDFVKSTGKQENGRKADLGEQSSKNHSSEDPPPPASKRPRFCEDTCDRISFAKPYSLEVTPECQNFIAKQLTKSLEKSLKEVSPRIRVQSKPEVSGIKLFATSPTPITEDDLTPVQKPQKRPKSQKKKKKSVSKSSKSDSSSSDSDTEKLRSVAVSADWVLNS